MIHPVLLDSGPVNLSLRVREALQNKAYSPSDGAYREFAMQVENGLMGVYQCDRGAWQCRILAGADDLAVEAMLAGLKPASGVLGILSNGPAGRRLLRIAQRLELPFHALEMASSSAFDAGEVAQWLDQQEDIKRLALAHHEPLIGCLNNLDELAPVCRGHGVDILLDATTSFGAENIDIRQWPLAALAASADRSLHGASGLSFVIAADSVLSTGVAPKSSYLDLNHWSVTQHGFHLPVQILSALQQALTELVEHGGWQGRRRRYLRFHQGNTRVLQALEAMPLLDSDTQSSMVRAYALAERQSAKALVLGLRKRGFVISAFIDDKEDRYFSISAMGDIDELQVARLHAALEECIRSLAATASD